VGEAALKSHGAVGECADPATFGRILRTRLPPRDVETETDKPLDEWHGVSINADGRVDKLTLSANYLTGEIPPELGSLSDLEVLVISGHSLAGGSYLTGAIPPELGDLSNLRRLSFARNSLTGEIPPELGDLSNLERLDLSANPLTGEIPLDFLDISLTLFHWGGNHGLCAPDTIEFDDWLDGLVNWSGPRCD